MRTSKIFTLVFLLTGGAPLLGPLSAGAEKPPQTAVENKATPLIRMDLLGRAPAQTAPPKRNIFSPRTGPAGRPDPLGAASPGGVGLPSSGFGAAAAASAAQTAAEPAAAPVFSIDLRYIGFVDSQKTRKIIGLVVYQGQARAVVEGEAISEGIRIGKIARDKIEVILPDSSTRAFPLEGEE
jgi:hypothetical protein